MDKVREYACKSVMVGCLLFWAALITILIWGA